MSNTIHETRAFLAGLLRRGPTSHQIPQLLRAVVRGAARGRFDRDDLLQDLMADLLVRTRKKQPGGVAELLALDDVRLVAALRRRTVQVRSVQDARSRLVKALRAHVTAALEHELRAPEAMPLTLVVGDRICRDLVRQAVAHLVAQRDPPECAPRALAAQLLALYFTVRTEDAGPEHHGEADDCALVRADAGGHLRALRQLLGPELARVVGLRAQGKSLAEVASGHMGVSTAHDHQTKAIHRVRQHARRHHLVREDLEPILQALVAH